MEIQTKTETTTIIQLTIQLTESEARAALHDPTALQRDIRRAIITADGSRATPAARQRKTQRAKPRPKAKTMICTTCGKVYKRPNVFKANVLKHGAGPVGAS